jgi:hypothetical protein
MVATALEAVASPTSMRADWMDKVTLATAGALLPYEPPHAAAREIRTRKCLVIFETPAIPRGRMPFGALDVRTASAQILNEPSTNS